MSTCIITRIADRIFSCIIELYERNDPFEFLFLTSHTVF